LLIDLHRFDRQPHRPQFILVALEHALEGFLLATGWVVTDGLPQF
jgi:hypothetical protein